MAPKEGEFLLTFGGILLLISVVYSPFLLRAAIRATRLKDPTHLFADLTRWCFAAGVFYFGTAAFIGHGMSPGLIASGAIFPAAGFACLAGARSRHWALERAATAPRDTAGFFMFLLLMNRRTREAAALGEAARAMGEEHPKVILNLAVAWTLLRRPGEARELVKSLDPAALTPEQHEVRSWVLGATAFGGTRRVLALVRLLVAGGAILGLVWIGSFLHPGFGRIFTTREGALIFGVVLSFAAGFLVLSVVSEFLRREGRDVAEVVRLLRSGGRAAQAVAVARARLAYRPDDAAVQRELADIERPVQTPSPPPIA